MTSLRIVSCLLLLFAAPSSLSAQLQPVQHVLIVTGLGGEPSFTATFNAVGNSLAEAAVGPWGVPADNLIWLAEAAPSAGQRITGRASRNAIDSAFTRLASRSASGDVVAIFLIGHGSGVGAESKLSIPGADPTAAEYARWTDRLAGRTVVMIIGASGSGDFVPVLARPGRIVITATRSSTERNESLFAARLAHGFSSREADADKDGLVSVLEAFNYADRAVAEAYQSSSRLQTEHAQLDDDGDGKASSTPGAAGVADGALARRVAFGRSAVPINPRVAALLAERQRLEVQVEDLRRRKESMSEAIYLRDLEALLVRIAEHTRAIRAAGQGGTP